MKRDPLITLHENITDQRNRYLGLAQRLDKYLTAIPLARELEGLLVGIDRHSASRENYQRLHTERALTLWQSLDQLVGHCSGTYADPINAVARGYGNLREQSERENWNRIMPKRVTS